jgi:hypothetical protein
MHNIPLNRIQEKWARVYNTVLSLSVNNRDRGGIFVKMKMAGHGLELIPLTGLSDYMLFIR